MTRKPTIRARVRNIPGAAPLALNVPDPAQDAQELLKLLDPTGTPRGWEWRTSAPHSLSDGQRVTWVDLDPARVVQEALQIITGWDTGRVARAMDFITQEASGWEQQLV